MDIRHLHQPFELEYLEAATYEAREHKNTYFELVFVLEGKGTQIINGHRLPYAGDKLFIIFPQDTHHFEVETTTRFFFIRFNSGFLKSQRKEWVQKLEFIFHNHHHLPGCILRNAADKPLIRSMVEALMREHMQAYAHRQEVIVQLLNTIITIAARNIAGMAPELAKKDGTGQVASLIHYIHEHIYEPDALRTERIAAHASISPAYISEYFKSKTGMSIREYIMAYKIKLVETRLRHTNMQVNEIVYEFGFSDASHLNRFFRKYHGIAPGEYRKALSDQAAR